MAKSLNYLLLSAVLGFAYKLFKVKYLNFNIKYCTVHNFWFFTFETSYYITATYFWRMLKTNVMVVTYPLTLSLILAYNRPELLLTEQLFKVIDSLKLHFSKKTLVNTIS